LPDALDHIGDDVLVAELYARLSRSQSTSGDWVAAFKRAEVLMSDEAAAVAGVSVDTVRRWCSAGADTGDSLGVLIAGTVWMISLPRLLAWIERRKGRPGRIAAEERAKKLRECRSRRTNLQPSGHADSTRHAKGGT